MQPGKQVSHVAAQGLEGRIGLGGPHGGNLAHLHAVEDVLQLGRHDDQALEGLADVDQAGADHLGESGGERKGGGI